MFKQATVFVVTAGYPHASELHAALEKNTFEPVAPSQEKSSGWVPPRGENESIFESVAGDWIAKFVIETKSVPAGILKRRVDHLAAEIEEDTGRKPGKKQRADLKEQARFDLLPNAFPRRTEVHVWFDTKNPRLVIGSTSNTAVDDVLSSLVRVLDGFEPYPLQTMSGPRQEMTEWLARQFAPQHFQLGKSCHLASDDGQVRYTNHALAVEEIRSHISKGKVAASLALQHDDTVDFELTDGLKLKKIKVVHDGLLQERRNAKDNFDGDVVMLTSALRSLIDGLVDSLGGLIQYQGTSNA